ncbi:MAG: AAA family ATPase [Desulfobacterales bacterium]|nr:AAA family ATPase [Desulfobacterales bacterium]
MRIISIQGRNIRSLYSDFQIDFEKNPLAQAGIFAIIGPTGAGKSSILDALCLALYNTCPRVENAKPDTPLDDLNAKDSRTVLSRGSAEGLAEVVFEVNQKRFRSRWYVRRSRNQVNGKFQNEKQELIDEYEHKIIASGPNNVKKAILKLTGLSFQQFTRSVLLAQGDFAAFLLAPADERSRLLEIITGMQIYTQISMQAHKKAQELTQQIKTIQSELQHRPVPSPEHLTQLQQDIQLKTNLAQTIHEHIEIREHQLRWYAQLKLFEMQFVKAKQVYESVLIEKKKAHTDQELLSRIQKAFQMKAEIERAKWTEEKYSVTQKTVEHHILEFTKASESYTGQQAELKKASQAYEDERNYQELLAPEVREAHRMDAVIENTSELLKTYHEQFEASAKEKKQLQQQIEQFEKQYSQINTTIHTLKQWFQENDQLQSIVEHWAFCKEVLQSLEETQNKEIIITKKNVDIQHKMNDIEKEMSSITIQLSNLDLKINGMNEQRMQLLDAEKQHNADYPIANTQKCLQETVTAKTHLEHLQTQFSKLDELSAQIQTMIQNKNTTTDQLKQLQDTLEETHKKKQDILSCINRSKQTLDELTLEFSVKELRSKLDHGNPCPVCGALDHPWKNKLPLQENVLISEQQQLNVYMQQDTEISQHVLFIEKKLAANNEKLAQQHENIRKIEHEIESNIKSTTKIRNDIARVLEPIPDLFALYPVTNDLSRPSDQWIDLLNKYQENFESAIAKSNGFRKDIDRLQQNFDALTKQQQELHKKRDTLTHLQKQQQQEMNFNTQSIEEILDQKEKAKQKLNAFILSKDWTKEFTASPKSFIKRIEKQVIQYKDKKQILEKNTEQMKRIDQDLNHFRIRYDAICEKHIRDDENTKKMQQELDTLSKKRHLLLKGMSTSVFINSCNKRVADLEHTLNLARDKEKQIALQVHEAKIQMNESKLQLEHIEKEKYQADHQLHHLLEQVQMAKEEAFTLIGYSDEFVNALEKRLAVLTNQVLHTEKEMLLREQDMQAFLKQNKPEQSHEMIDTHLKELHQKKDMIQQEIESIKVNLGVLKNQLLRVEELQQQKKQLENQGASWFILDELLGHSQGKSFRQYAQTLTLNHLVTLANDYLNQFAPRYRLFKKQGDNLDIAVIDRDQANEIRNINTLSGGETFLASLALSLALSQLSSHKESIHTLFIDEGFGLLDTDTLDHALAALELLQAQGKVIGLISHLPVIQERIACQIRVVPQGAGRSLVSL